MKNSGINKSTMRIAICGVVSALGLVLMMITSLIPVGTYALPCMAGLFIIAVVIEYGYKWALGVYVVVSVLSLFLSADKEAAVFFIMIFGYYPILKSVIESKLKNKLIQFLLKLVVFNAAAVIAFFITTALLSVPAEEYTIMGMYLPLVFLLMGNVMFIIYDYAVTLLAFQYINRLRGKLFGKR